MRQAPKNPAGFATRLKALMDGWGYKSRELAELAGVSHQTIENWLADRVQAGPDEVSKVATVFGWTQGQLYAGEAPAGVMDRLAELDGYRAMARRYAVQLVVGGEPLEADDVRKMDAALFEALPNRPKGA